MGDPAENACGVCARIPDYPRCKLDIKIVVERRDLETLAAIARLKLPGRYDVVVVPDGGPMTKPRALDVALAAARGELLVVFDAEDVPAPPQLRRAAARFAADDALDCLQARLAIRNPGDSWLSQLFALEYAVLFDLVNPGLCALDLPIALGGTSNHFRVETLREIGGWDPWNVTEDIDIGLRLARRGGRIDALESDTTEEAPYEFAVWLSQRVRWQKGWMQTLIVHSRHPLRFWRELGPRRASAAAAMVVGAVLSGLFAPVFALDTLWRAVAAANGGLDAWREATDVFVYLLAALGVQSIVIPALAARRRRSLALPLSRFGLLPIYYLMVSMATWIALADLIVRPFYWAKTPHGRSPAPMRPAAPAE